MTTKFDHIVIDENPDAVVAVAEAGTVLYWNRAAERIFGYSKVEAEGQLLEDLIIPPDQLSEEYRVRTEALRQAPAVYETVRRRKDGVLLHVSITTKAVSDSDGEFQYYISTKKDVTHLKVIRDAKLVDSRFRDLLESTPDAIVMVNVTGRIVLVNSQAEAVFRYQRSEMIGEPVEMLLPQRFHANHHGSRRKFFELPRTRTMGAGLALFGLRKGGEEFPVEISLSPLDTEEGTMVMSAVRDITDRKKAEGKFRSLLEAAPDAMVIVQHDGRIELVNSQTELLFGYTREEMLGQPVELLMPDRFRTKHTGHRGQFFGQPQARTMGAGLELHARRKDGTEFPVEISLSPLDTEDGMLAMSTIRDITERKNAEQEFKALLEAAPDAMVIVNREGKIVRINSQVTKIFGWEREELVGQSVETLMPARYRNKHPEHRHKFADSPRARAMGMGLALLGLRRDGTEFPVEISLSPLETKDGLFVTGAIRDATERKRFEDALKQKNDELAAASRAKDTFLANMSHELRTPLNAIIGFTGTMLMKLPGPLTPDQDKQLKIVQSSARHLLALINDLLDVAKIEAGKTELYIEPVNCQSVVEEVIGTLMPEANRKGLELLVGTPTGNVMLRSDRRALSQITLNLVGNALKFTEKGSVHITLTEIFADERRAVAVAVFDTGKGIRAEDQSKLFAPFTQIDASKTKPHHGTGLGLHLSRKLAELLGGDICWSSEIDKGSVFTLTIAEQ